MPNDQPAIQLPGGKAGPMLVVVWLATAVSTQDSPPAAVLDTNEWIRRLQQIDWLWQPPQPGETCRQWSSFDRASLAGPGNANAWYANNDRGHYLRSVEKPDGNEHVMVECEGPGAIARIWSANPSGLLHFDIDDERVWSIDFAQLCAGEIPHVPKALVGVHARGGNCYLPIPFAKSLRLSATAGDLYYAVDVVQMPAATAVVSFAPAALAALAPVDARLLAPMPSTAANVSEAADTEPIAIAAGRIVRSLDVRLLPRRLPTPIARADLEGLLLVIAVGDETTVRVPLADFYALGQQLRPFDGALFANRVDHLRCGWPMPFPRAGSIRLEVDGGPPLAERPFRPVLSVASEPLSVGSEPLLFRATYRQQRAMPTRPFRDHAVLAVAGRGRFVGCALAVRNPARLWWGEGDEKITVDGEAFPSWFGTGTEDYFGYAWCDPTPFAAALHAQIECQGPMNFGNTQLLRCHVLDSVPFQQSLRFDLEVWHWAEDKTIDYTTTAYWYGAADASAADSVLPAAAERALPALAGPPTLAVDGALEGEALAVISCSGGQHEVQDLAIFEAMFSRDAHRWWRDGRPGDALTLRVPIADAGRYRVAAAFVMADDFGIVQAMLAGTPLGAPFDGYAERVGSSGRIELGEIELRARDAELVLKLVGNNPKAKPSHMVGLDYLLLERVPDRR
jgi:hypothetical protein